MDTNGRPVSIAHRQISIVHTRTLCRLYAKAFLRHDTLTGAMITVTTIQGGLKTALPLRSCNSLNVKIKQKKLLLTSVLTTFLLPKRSDYMQEMIIVLFNSNPLMSNICKFETYNELPNI